MSILRRWLGTPTSGSSDIAKDRLRLVLVHDRLKMPPENFESLKGDLLAVLSRYFDIDRNTLVVDVQRGRDFNQLITTISVRRRK
jgi:cell division topological specificity factor